MKSLKIAVLSGFVALVAAPAYADDPKLVGVQTEDLVVPLQQVETLPASTLFSAPIEIENQAKDVDVSTVSPVIIRQDFEFSKDFKRAATYDIIWNNQAFISTEQPEKIDLREYNDSALTSEGRHEKPLVSSASVGVRRTF